MSIPFIVVGICAIGILLALFLQQSIKKINVENARMNEIAGFIKTGAMAYLMRQYKVIAIFLAVMAIVLLIAFGWIMMVCFIFGAVLSILAGFVGMRSAVMSNVRTASEAQKGLASAFKVAFSGGAIMGLMVVCLGAAGVSIVYAFTNDTTVLTGFCLGASSIALFCRVGGGIYTKAADVGADLVGKVEAGIPEDDPRNPAVIADNVGDNVGDVAGMGADLFESYVGCIVSALVLATSMADAFRANSLFIVLAIVGAGIAASLIGVVIVRFIKAKNVQSTLNLGTYIAAGLLAIAAAVLSWVLFGNLWLFAAIACGIVCGVLLGFFTEIYTSGDYKSVKKIAQSSETGAATTVLSGYAIGLKSTVLPILALVGAIIGSFILGQQVGGDISSGFFGVVLAALGMLATVGITISVDAYGPIADNAGGIAEMSGAGEEVRNITDHLDAVGNTTAAIGKGFSIGSAALTALALFTAYAQAVGLFDKGINLISADVISGMFIGGMLVFLFSAMTIDSVSKAAYQMIEEVRSQFRSKPGIMQGTEQPDYKRCVDISTRAAIKEMIVPSIIAIVAPVLVGLWSTDALGGLLCGATLTGVLMAIMMSNAGGAWDNAKKYIEGGHNGGKGSEAHKAAVIGDTVGDPFKDTAGPSLNILIKLMSIVALVFAPLFM